MLKDSLKKFFLHTKTGKVIMKSLAALNTVEGIIHLVVAAIGAWGLIDVSVYDARAWLPVVENTVFGVFSLLTGYALGMHHHH